ncbi:MAG: DUF4058 family protein [Isosphaeraceae bacterium]
MPVHDWNRVEAGIFPHFHLCWIDTIQRALNAGLLPEGYYALAEQHASSLVPDVLTLRGLQESSPGPEPDASGAGPYDNGGGLKLGRPRVRITAESDIEYYHRKQRSVVVRHVSGDHVVAVVEILSPGNKDSRRAFGQLVEKAAWLLEHHVHLLIVDLSPPTARDPRGVHGAIWDELTGQPFEPPADKPLTLVAYERESGAYRAYVEPVAVGDMLPDMPLFLRPGAYVDVPLETTYQSAFEAVPTRWRRVVAGEG